jgi:hypothetical protein
MLGAQSPAPGSTGSHQCADMGVLVTASADCLCLRQQAEQYACRLLCIAQRQQQLTLNQAAARLQFTTPYASTSQAMPDHSHLN